MWCDHRAWREAQRITGIARHTELEAIRWCGGTYSSEWGFSKLLHWLRTNPAKRRYLETALEHCDMVAAVLCGIVDPDQVPRSVCAMGHKWMWSKDWGGLPPDEFLLDVDPLLEGVRAKISRGCYSTSNKIAGRLCATWAQKLGLQPGIPIPVGALDAHWDAVGAGVRLGDVVNVIGTSTCVIAVSDSQTLVPGLCGIVPGSVHPEHTGIEAGLSATGDIFDAIARRARTTVEALSEKAIGYKPGQTGLMRLTWDNGDRTVLVNPELGGATIGWNLLHAAEDFQPAVGRDEEVLRLEVPMDDALLVRGRQRPRDLPRIVQGFPLWNAAGIEQHTQRLSLEQLGDDIGCPVVRLHVIYGMDVRMVQGTRGSSLPLEAKQPFRVGRAGRGKDFDGNVSTKRRVAGAIHLAHAARAKQRAEFVSAEPRIRLQWHVQDGNATAARPGLSNVPPRDSPDQMS